MSWRSVRPSVVLPQPDSPTRLNVSPGHDLEVDAVDRVDRADLAPQHAAVDREVLLEALDDDQRLVRRHVGRGRDLGCDRRDHDVSGGIVRGDGCPLDRLGRDRRLRGRGQGGRRVDDDRVRRDVVPRLLARVDEHPQPADVEGQGAEHEHDVALDGRAPRDRPDVDLVDDPDLGHAHARRLPGGVPEVREVERDHDECEQPGDEQGGRALQEKRGERDRDRAQQRGDDRVHDVGEEPRPDVGHLDARHLGGARLDGDERRRDRARPRLLGAQRLLHGSVEPGARLEELPHGADGDHERQREDELREEDAVRHR